MLKSSIVNHSRFISGFAFLIGACLFSAANGQAPAEAFPGIVPLRSTREEIAQQFELPKDPINTAVFVTPKSVVEAVFASERCDEHGWNVAAGTLVALEVLPKENILFDPTGDKRFESLGPYFFSRSLGLEYEIRGEFGWPRLYRVRVLPKSSDAKFRCPGFPPYDFVVDHYYPYQSGDISRPNSWTGEALDIALTYTTERNPRQVFVFIYAPKSQRSAADRVIENTKKHVATTNGVEKSLVTVKFGGIRCKLEFETFTAPIGYPPAQPRPRPICK